MSILSFDIGIKNLCFCELDKNGKILLETENNEIKFIRFEQLTKNSGPRYLRILNNQLYKILYFHLL